MIAPFRSSAIAMLLFALACSGAASAGEGPNASPEDAREKAQLVFNKAEQAERELRFADALTGYEEAMKLAPSGPFVVRARARAGDLRAHREGEFGPLKKLARVRSDPAKNRDPAEIDALFREARGFPDGRVRGEALLVVAQAYAHVLGEPDKAIVALEAVLSDPHAGRSTRVLALSEAVLLYKQKGDLERARIQVERDPTLLPGLTREVRALLFRATIGWVCIGILVVLGALAVRGAIRGAMRLKDVRKIVPKIVRRGHLAFAFYVGAGGAIFVRYYRGEGDPLPFVALGMGIALVWMLVSAWGLADASPSRAGRGVRAVFAALGVLATAYLILWKTNGDYLVPLGL